MAALGVAAFPVALDGTSATVFTLAAIAVGPLMFGLLALLIGRTIIAEVPFTALPPQARARALATAWSNPGVGSEGLVLSGYLVCLVASLAVFAVTSGLALLTDMNLPAQFGPGFCAVLVLCDLTASYLLVFGIGRYVGAPAAVERVRRAAAVAWAQEWYPAWEANATSVLSQHTLDRFQLGGDTQVFSLRSRPILPGLLIRDMPPSQVHYVQLAAGTYLGIRHGDFLNVVATSRLQCESADPATLSSVVVVTNAPTAAEREFHYVDIASIDYTQGQSSGTLVLTIAGAAPLTYKNEKGNAIAAIEEIRKRTREAKLRR